MRLDNCLDEIESQACSVSSARQLVVDTIETLEYLLCLIFRDAGAFIAERKRSRSFR